MIWPKFSRRVRDLNMQYPAQHPNVLRKVAPTPPSPTANGTVANTVNEKVFRAPAHLCDLTMHTCRGALAVPASGIVQAAASHTDLHQELRDRGFREMRQVDRAGKCSDGGDHPADAFHRDRLTRIGGNDPIGGLRDRAAKAASVAIETRQEDFGGPGPATTYCRSAAEFRRRYFGREN